jgi:hypothetical protein
MKARNRLHEIARGKLRAGSSLDTEPASGNLEPPKLDHGWLRLSVSQRGYEAMLGIGKLMRVMLEHRLCHSHPPR